MQENLNHLLKATRLFSSLSEDSIKEILLKSTLVELKKDEILFRQGDISEDVFILIEGKLAAEITDYSGNTKIVGRISPGEPIGELGVLSYDRRSLTVKALTDSKSQINAKPNRRSCWL